MGTGSGKHKSRATLAGFAAVLMWALLAAFTDATGDIQPFQLAAMTFTIGALVGAIWALSTRSGEKQERISPKVALLGGLGLFAYHALYFAAIKNAPAVEASLIAYLWPLLIVIASALLPGETLRAHHVAGALIGFVGATIIITGGQSLSLEAEHAGGYGLALSAAFTWTTYSLLSRRMAKVPTTAVIYYCAVSAILSVAAHLVFETTVIPATIVQWSSIAGLGLLPVGAAFYVWDFAMKHGDVQIVGASSYAAPLLSTIILIAFAGSPFSWPVAIACILITVGATLAAKDLIFKPGS